MRGKRCAYYRRRGFVRRLRGPDNRPVLPGDAGFADAYAVAERAFGERYSPAPVHVALGSMAALVVAYRASDEWAALAPLTRRDYDAALAIFETRFGQIPVAALDAPFVQRVLDTYRRDADGNLTPRRANRMVDVLRLLLAWGVRRGWRKDNPALRPGRLRTGPGYVAWTPVQVTQFLACEAVAEPVKRAVALGWHTGQRLGDCIALTWSARESGGLAFVQSKTGARVWIPEAPELSAALDAAPRTAVTILTRKDGRPWKSDHLKHALAHAVHAAGLPRGLSFHGLRKGRAAQLAESGASASEIQAITGHRTLGEVTRYTASADQRRRAAAAVARITGPKGNVE